MRASRVLDGPAAPALVGETAGARATGAAPPFAERYQAAIADLEGDAAASARPAAATATVSAGDTLWSMVRHELESRSECVSDGQVLAAVRRVSAANRLENPDLLVPGQRIDLGGEAAAPMPRGIAGETPSAPSTPLAAPDGEPSGVPLEIGSLIDGSRDRVTSSFGMRDDPLCRKPRFHAGIDVAAASGTPARAAAGGVVSFAGEQRGYGQVVVVDHGGGVSTVYAHASALLVRTGDRVTSGSEVIRVGSSGRATGPHLHFELRKDGVAVDPTQLAHLLDGASRA